MTAIQQPHRVALEGVGPHLPLVEVDDVAQVLVSVNDPANRHDAVEDRSPDRRPQGEAAVYGARQVEANPKGRQNGLGGPPRRRSHPGVGLGAFKLGARHRPTEGLLALQGPCGPLRTGPRGEQACPGLTHLHAHEAPEPVPRGDGDSRGDANPRRVRRKHQREAYLVDL